MATREFLVGLGLGVGVGVATSLTVVASLKALSDAGQTSVPVSGSRTGIQRRPGQCPVGLPVQNFMNLTQIRELEDSFFRGIDRRASLTGEQINTLKTFLVAAVGENVQDLMACQTLQDILHLLRILDVISPNRYRRIQTLLQNSGIGVDVTCLDFHVEHLQLAVGDLGPPGYERDMFEMDVLILHTEQDREAVLTFKQHLMHDTDVQGLTVQTVDEFCGPNKTLFNSLGDVYSRTRYVFVYMSRHMVSSELNRFLSEMLLLSSLEDPDRKHRIVPVWSTRERLPVTEMRPFPGVKYWMYLEAGQSDDVKQIFLSNVNRMLVEGREEFVRAYA